MHRLGILLALLLLAGCGPKNDQSHYRLPDEGAEDAALLARAEGETSTAEKLPPEVKEPILVLLTANLPPLSKPNDSEIEDRRKKRRAPPAPLEWRIAPVDVLAIYYDEQPELSPISWNGIVIGYRRKQHLIGGNTIERWYQDSDATTPLQGIVITVSHTKTKGGDEFELGQANDAWSEKYVIQTSRGGAVTLRGYTRGSSGEATFAVRQNPKGSSRPWHLDYTDKHGLHEADLPAPQPPARPSPGAPTEPVASPAPSPAKPASPPPSSGGQIEAERQRKTVEAGQKAIELVRQAQEAQRQAEQARQAQQQAEQARQAQQQAEQARRAQEQADQVRRAQEQVAQARKAREAAEATRQPVFPIIPH